MTIKTPADLEAIAADYHKASLVAISFATYCEQMAKQGRKLAALAAIEDIPAADSTTYNVMVHITDAHFHEVVDAYRKVSDCPSADPPTDAPDADAE